MEKIEKKGHGHTNHSHKEGNKEHHQHRHGEKHTHGECCDHNHEHSEQAKGSTKTEAEPVK